MGQALSPSMSGTGTSPRSSYIQNVGSMSITVTPAGTGEFLGVAGHLTFIAKGLKLDDVFVNTSQLIDSSKRVVFIDGSTGALVNSVTAGTITLRSSVVGTTLVSGDLVTLGGLLQKNPPTSGVNITIKFKASNGTTSTEITWIFSMCTLVRMTPVMLAGNDVPTHDVVFSYDDYSRSDV
jgi:hypothetical protein